MNMSGAPRSALSSKTRMPDQSAIASLKSRLRGELIQPVDSEYQTARKVYNAMIDRYPTLIARCADVADVIAAVNFAREHDLLLSIRGGGHNGAGLAVCDNGLVVDLSRMRGIRVDPQARMVRVEGGCRLGDMDHATHAFGLATPCGIESTTGIAGLALGGGIGHLSRKCGLTVDNLTSADMVLADGRFVTVSAMENEDLFWAIRGGGGNFGVVTSFLFRCHPIHTVVGGPTFWPLEKTAKVLRWYRDFILEAPPELSGFFAFHTVPAVPLFPEPLWLKKICGVVWCYCGDPGDADRLFKPVREFESPVLHAVQAMPHPALQSMFDDLYPTGLQWYWRGDFVREISDEAIAVHEHYAAEMPTPLSAMHLYPIDGAPHAVGKNETAFSYRDANWAQVMVGVHPDPSKNRELIDWTRNYWAALHPYSAGGAYVNFMMEEGSERIRATYRDNYDRLAAVKRKFDPTNLFRVNQNIPPHS